MVAAPTGEKGQPTVIPFGPFEADLRSQEVRKQGRLLRLKPQSFQVLRMLLERPGELVTREELRRALWSSDTFVDFEHGLNAAVNRLRECLGDSAEKPRYIETLPRRGYRLIASVNGVRSAAAQSEPTATAQPPRAEGPVVTAAVKQHKAPVIAAVFAVLVLLGAGGFGIHTLLHPPMLTPFAKFTITQVTNSGKAVRAAISPDGRYVLSVEDSGMESLWLRNVATRSDTEIIAPSATHYEGLTFSPDGNYVYFRKAGRAKEQCCNLYRVPTLGGAPQVVLRSIYSDIAFSAGSQRFAYLRPNAAKGDQYSLVTASLEGDNEVVLHSDSGISEKALRYVAWSPSSNEISFPLFSVGNEGGIAGAIDTVSARTHELRRFATFRRKFPEEIRWSPGGRTLFAVYRQTGANWSRPQIGFLRRGGTDIEPITRDTNRYKTLTFTADGRTLAAVLGRSYSNLEVLSKIGRGFGEPRTVLSQSNEFDEWSQINWSADGNLLVSNTGRLFKLAPDGKNQGEILSDPGALIVRPSTCGPDYLVLTWTFHAGTSVPGIWRTNADGSGPVKLTDGRFDFDPVCSPDQKWAYYVDFTDSHIFRVPLDGSGKREPILPEVEVIGGVGVSPDGKTLAAGVAGETSEQEASIALFDLPSSTPARMLGALDYAEDICGNGTLRFTPGFSPDGKSVTYVRREGGVDNVWAQPLDGSAGYPITDFKSERIWSFSLSPDGKSLAVLRGHFDSDVILLQESTH